MSSEREKVDRKLWLAPLAGITLPPVRRFFARLGAELVHTEMVSASGLLFNNKKTANMLEVLPGEAPVVLQLFAGDVESLVRAADYVLNVKKLNYYAIGINMACPMPKVLKRGAGSRLLEHPDIAFPMVSELKKFRIPIWVKIRKASPASEKMIPTDEFISGLVDAGADNICLHGRTPAQRYEGIADREIVCKMAQKFPGKISASGDVYSHADAQIYFDAGCVGVMAARGALANPFIFRDDEAYPPAEEQLGLLQQFGREVSEWAGPRIAVIMVKRLLAGMLKGLHGAGVFRRDIARELEYENIMHLLESGIKNRNEALSQMQ